MFFIFGMPRSGTTLLAQCLNAHSKIVIPHETDFIIPMAFIFDRIQDKSIGRELIYKLIVNSTYFPGSLGEYIGKNTVKDVVFSCDYRPDSILSAIYSEIARVSGAVLAGDKSPNDLNFLRMLVKTGGLSSDTKVIHIVRDIRDLMISVNKTGWVSDLDLYFPRFWCNQNLYLNAIYKNNQKNYTLIRYEDMVADPEFYLNKLAAFLGVEFEPGMVVPERRHHRYRGDQAHTNIYKPISKASVGNHVSLLDEATRNNYETQAREALTKFGYIEDIT